MYWRIFAVELRKNYTEYFSFFSFWDNVFGYIKNHGFEKRFAGPECATSLNARALVLNQGYEPIGVCAARKALMMLLLLKAELIAARSDRTIRSATTAFPYPSIIRISSYIYVPHRNIDLSRKNILRRDGMRCQYCGSSTAPLTIDHIIPRSRGGGDIWENLTTACIICNNRKGNRTPEEAHMRLISQPRRPNHILFLRQYIGKVDESWKPYLFMD